MTEPTKDGKVREVLYAPDGRRAYDRVMEPAEAFDKGIGLIVSALKAAGRDEAADDIWSRHVNSEEIEAGRIPDLAKIFGGLR